MNIIKFTDEYGREHLLSEDDYRAKLLADAAPLMLETLRWTLKNYASGPTKEINARITAAIAKAEGKL